MTKDDDKLCNSAGTFTIKQIEKDGHQGLRQGTTVWLQPVTNGAKGTLCLGGDPSQPDGVTQYQSGMCYVMNEFGNTVARYDMDAMNAR